MLSRRTGVLVLLAALLGLLQIPPVAAASVTIEGFEFKPARKKVAQGGTVTWTNMDSAAHTATRSGTVGWDTGNLGQDETSAAVGFEYAAKYDYICSIHPSMEGQIRVPVKAKPRSGTTATRFLITVGSGAPPDGHVFDIKWRKGSGKWRTLERGTTDPTHRFKAGSRGDGRYRFKSRVRDTGGGTTKWSPIRSVRVG